jgi:antitoxin CptB
LELDLILVPFADKYFQHLTAAEQDDYVKLLESEDQDLLAWMLDHRQPEDPAIARIIQRIRSCHGSAEYPT